MRDKPNHDFNNYVDRAIFGQRISMPSENRIDRRTFMKVSGGVLAAGITPARKLEATADNNTPYPAKWYPFTGHPDSDTCWSLSVGPDGRIYAAACAETVPGGVVKPVRYNEHRDELEYLFDLAERVGDPGDSGRATQCKAISGVAASVLEHRRYGYQFGAAVTGRDGEIVFGEDDNSGHLWLYFPKVLARQSP